MVSRKHTNLHAYSLTIEHNSEKYEINERNNAYHRMINEIESKKEFG